MDKINKIYELKNELDLRRPLNQSKIKRIKENYMIKNTYNSNAIEGNTLTEMETRVIIETGIIVAKKTLREHVEVKNHVEALLYIENLKNDTLSEYDIKSIHSIILDGIDRHNVGKYRDTNVRIGGATHDVTEAHLVSQAIYDLLKWYISEEITIDRLEYYLALDKSYCSDYKEEYDFFYNCILESLEEHVLFMKKEN